MKYTLKEKKPECDQIIVFKGELDLRGKKEEYRIIVKD
jgi:hypothetical protein